MPGDFNKPSGSSARTAFMQEIRDTIRDVARMLNPDTATANIPAGAIRRNPTTKAFEAWNGTAWGALDLSGQSVGSATNATNATNADTVDTYHAASLLARSNHTGSQDGSTIVGGTLGSTVVPLARMGTVVGNGVLNLPPGTGVISLGVGPGFYQWWADPGYSPALDYTREISVVDVSITAWIRKQSSSSNYLLFMKNWSGSTISINYKVYKLTET